MANKNNKKIPCGGFYLGDGLTMDGNTLKSSGGKQVQTDWNQNDTTAKDYIKNRPGGYEEGFEITWDGDTTGRAKITAEGVPYVWYKVSDKILTADDIIGGTATMIRNGVSQSLVVTSDIVVREDYGAIIGEAIIIIATKQGTYVSTMGGFSISIPETGVYFAYMSSAGTTMYISSLSNITVRPFDDKYIPDTVARKDEIYTNYNHTMSITWDGNKDGKDTFVFNGHGYYKMSDDVPAFKRIQSLSTTSSGSSELSELYEGENCYRAGFSIVVTKAGACKLASNEGGTAFSFTAPSAGIYFWTDNGRYQTSLELTSFIEQDGIIVNSANKKWKIAVDDSGVISATEIPE